MVDRAGLGRRRVGDELLEPRADAPVVGAELLGPKDACSPEPSRTWICRSRSLDPRELLVVEEELEDVRGLRGARELGVERLVGAVRPAQEEVGDAAPALVREDALVDDVGLAVADRLRGRAGGAVAVALGSGISSDGHPLGAQALEVGLLVLEPLAEDQLRLLVLDLGPVELAARVRERERRQVLAGQEGRPG